MHALYTKYTSTVRKVADADNWSLACLRAAGLLALLLSAGQPVIAQYHRVDSLASAVTGAPAMQRNIIKTNPLSLLASGISVFYERSLTNKLSVVIGYGSVGKDFGFSGQIENGKYLVRRGTVEVRRYFGHSNRPMRGFYAGPYLRAGTLRESSYVDDPPGQHLTGRWQMKDAVVWAPGLMSGYQLLTRRFAADAFVGLQAQLVSGSLVGSNQVVEGLTSPVMFRVGLAVGLPF